MSASTEMAASPLQQMAATTATDYWNDSCSVEELTYSVARGATGATSNPTIVGEVLKKEMHLWRDRIHELIAGNPHWTEDEVTWKLNEEMAVRGAEILLPVFEREDGRKGRLSIQTNPKLYRDASRITEQALHFGALAPNMQVKVPATRAGVQAAEDVTAAGVSINATVCFTVPQAIAFAEAVERGLQRREAAGEDVSRMSPVVTMMIGRLDDWIEVLVKRDGILTNPGYRALGRRRLPQAGVRDLPGAGLPRQAAGRCLPPPSALVGADRRRHRADDPVRVATPVQRVGPRGRSQDGRSGAGGDRRGAVPDASPTSGAPTTPTG